MGAVDFSQMAIGRNAEEAYRDAVEQAEYEHGHSGYTGTIAETRGFFMIELPKGLTLRKAFDLAEELESIEYAQRDIEDTERYNRNAKRGQKMKMSAERKRLARKDPLKRLSSEKVSAVRAIRRAHSEKWGPCGCIAITGKALRDAKARHGLKGTQKKVYEFFGIAAS